MRPTETGEAPRDTFAIINPGDNAADVYFYTRLTPPTLEAVQAMVGGYVEMVSLFKGAAQMLVNEEGLLKQLAPNPVATQWAHAGGRTDISMIVGPAVILTGKARWE